MMHMYVWTRRPRFIAVAQAENVEKARAAMLASDELDGSGDGSCPERDKAREFIRTTNPAIWLGENAEFALTDSAELIEVEAECERLRKLLAPSPCGVEGHRKANGHFHIDQLDRPSERLCHCDMPEAQRKVCAVCAELSRVRQQARAEALAQVGEHHHPFLNYTGDFEVDAMWVECSCGWNKDNKLDPDDFDTAWELHIRALIPAEAQGEPTRVCEHCKQDVSAPAFDGHVTVLCHKPGCLDAEIESRVSERTKRLREALAWALGQLYCAHDTSTGFECQFCSGKWTDADRPEHEAACPYAKAISSYRVVEYVRKEPQP